MSNSTERGSATIYQFPLRGRFAPNSPAANAPFPHPYVEAGSGWYHQEAVDEAARSRTSPSRKN
jgi:hypothetical protein